jgi:hypothetical protein
MLSMMLGMILVLSSVIFYCRHLRRIKKNKGLLEDSAVEPTSIMDIA